MTLPLTKLGKDVFAGRDAAGHPRQVDNGDAVVWSTEMERALDGAVVGRIDQVTWAGLSAIAGARAGQPAQVYGPDAGTHTDPVVGGTVANTGTFIWSASPAGWRRVGGLPAAIIHALNTGAGTANAVQATVDATFATEPYRALVSVNFTAANSGAMTLAINGEPPRDLVTNTGEAIPDSYVTAGMAALVQIDENGDYRFFSYGDASAAQAAVEAALASFNDRYLGAFANDAAATAAAGGSPVVGQLYANTTDDLMKRWNGSGWVDATQTAGTITTNVFDADGTEDTFTLASDTDSVLYVSAGTLIQTPGVDYTVTGDQLVFASAPVAGTKVIAVQAEIAPLGQTMAAQVSLVDAGGHYASATVEGALEEAGADLSHLRAGRYGNALKVSEYADLGAALTAAAAIPRRVTVEINLKGTVPMTTGTVVPANVDLMGLGRDQTRLDYSGVASADMPYYGGLRYAMMAAGAGLTLVNQSYATTAIGDTKITFDSAHGLISKGDILSIYKPADGSFLGSRPYYRAGQRVRVADIQGGTKHWLADTLVDLYGYGGGANAEIYIQAPRAGRFEGFTVDLTGTSVVQASGFLLKQVNDVTLDDIGVVGVLYAGLEVLQGYNVEGRNLYCSTLIRDNFNTDGLTPSGNDYAALITTSTRVRFQGQFSGNWAGTDYGGGDGPGASQNYLCEYHDSVITRTAGMHGNLQSCGYRRCTISEAVGMCGKDPYLIDCNVSLKEKPSTGIIGVSEIKGGIFLLQNVNIYTTKNTGAASRGAIDVSAGGVHDSYMTEDMVFVVDGGRWNMPAETEPLRALSTNPTWRMSFDLRPAFVNVPAASELARIDKDGGSNGRLFRIVPGHLVQSAMSPLYSFGGGWSADRIIT